MDSNTFGNTILFLLIVFFISIWLVASDIKEEVSEQQSIEWKTFNTNQAANDFLKECDGVPLIRIQGTSYKIACLRNENETIDIRYSEGE